MFVPLKLCLEETTFYSYFNIFLFHRNKFDLFEKNLIFILKKKLI